ncbi:MAG: alpha/beta fold hydrolase, partial [Sciscionella sp.]|nr:alpha/beta fold hydrolase [Sciscionella sp.]
MLGVLALAAGLVACTTSTPTTGSAGAPPSTEKRGPTGTVPSSLDAFYGQTLSWGPCRDYATTQQDQQLYNNAKLDCARVKVPLDYGKPQGKTITIGVLRAKATDPSHRIGSLLMNPGGPGGSGMEAAASLLGNYDKTDLAKRFDLIGFDPRGIGASDPHITCLTDAEHDQLRTEDLDVDTSPSGVAKEEAQQRQFAKQCAHRTPDGTTMLENVGSRDVAKDMDVLRSVLGDKKLSYIGFSYGTRIGSTY